MRLITDIETVPLASSLAAPYPEADRQPPSNYKNVDAIERWREKDRAEWQAARIKECSLNPRLGRIVALGLDDDVLMAPSEAAEATVLAGFWQAAAPVWGRVVTFNGNFDLNFIVLRSLALGIEPSVGCATVREWFARYRVRPHFDCRAVLTNWDYRTPGTLSEWAAFLGIPSSDQHAGADVYDLYQAGDFDAIASHCLADLTMTAAMYERLQPMFGSVEG